MVNTSNTEDDNLIPSLLYNDESTTTKKPLEWNAVIGNSRSFMHKALELMAIYGRRRV